MPNIHRYINEIKHIVGDQHVTAQDVMTELKKIYPLIGQATVYRNLQEMVDDNILMKTKGVGTTILFELHKKPHGHILCKGGNMVYDIDLPIDIDDIEFPAGFVPETISILVEGRYQDMSCKGKLQKEKN